MTRNRRGDDSKNLNRRDRFQTCPYQPNHHYPITTTPKHQQKSANKPRRSIKHTHQPVGAVREPPYQPNNQSPHHRSNILINHPYLSIDATHQPTRRGGSRTALPAKQPITAHHSNHINHSSDNNRTIHTPHHPITSTHQPVGAGFKPAPTNQTTATPTSGNPQPHRSPPEGPASRTSVAPNPIESEGKEARPCIARFCVHWYDVVRKSDWHALVPIHARMKPLTTDWRQVKLVKESRRDEIPYITD